MNKQKHFKERMIHSGQYARNVDSCTSQPCRGLLVHQMQPENKGQQRMASAKAIAVDFEKGEHLR